MDYDGAVCIPLKREKKNNIFPLLCNIHIRSRGKHYSTSHGSSLAPVNYSHELWNLRSISIHADHRTDCENWCLILHKKILLFILIAYHIAFFIGLHSSVRSMIWPNETIHSNVWVTSYMEFRCSMLGGYLIFYEIKMSNVHSRIDKRLFFVPPFKWPVSVTQS